MSDTVVEVRMTSGATDEDLLGVVDALEQLGASQLELAERAEPPRAWARLAHAVDEAERAVQDRLRGLAVVASVRAAPLTQMDWNSVARLGMRPASFGPLVVVPPGLPPPEDAELILEIDSGGAFGSGLHPSTALVLEQLVQLDLPSELLDLGTGTGILALAALRLGAQRAVGTDIDAEIIEVARRNALDNGLADRLELHVEAPDALGRQFPLVCANVLAAPLTDLAPKLVRALAPGATLLLSGLTHHQVDDVVAAYRNMGLWWVGQKEEQGWVSLALRPSW